MKQHTKNVLVTELNNVYDWLDNLYNYGIEGAKTAERETIEILKENMTNYLEDIFDKILNEIED